MIECPSCDTVFPNEAEAEYIIHLIGQHGGVRLSASCHVWECILCGQSLHFVGTALLDNISDEFRKHCLEFGGPIAHYRASLLGVDPR